MRRIVIDTNVLVASAYNSRSASRRIVEACLAGKLVMIVSPAMRREYEHILRRAVRNDGEAARLQAAIEQAETVVPETQPRVVADDPDDDKFLAAALAGKADALVTNDDHLLALGGHEGLPILRPVELLPLIPYP
jgi:putative PIN family toxin of toxin-antitoxin system